jgi:hypothetical protein
MPDITAEYSREDFLTFLRNDFLPDDFEYKYNRKTIYTETSKKIKRVEKLGYCKSLDVSVYEFTHASPGDSRVALSRESFKIIETADFVSNALAVFRSETDPNWRLSLITSDYRPADTKITHSLSNPRRFSWLLGKGCKKHTPTAILFSRGNVKSIADLTSRFAIDTVAKNFTQSYSGGTTRGRSTR